MPRSYSPESPLSQFDPNAGRDPYATYIPGRSPAWKVHASRGLATNALGYRPSAGALYEFVDGKWVELVRIEYTEHLRTTACDNCGQSLLVTRMVWNPNYQYGNPNGQPRQIPDPDGRQIVKATQRLKRRGRKLVTPLEIEILCEVCS